LIEQPIVDEGSDFCGLKTDFGDGFDVTLQPCERGVEAVADLGLDQAAESLDRIEFRAVRRKRQEPQIGRDARVVGR
jgi:hypothetical protein